MISNLLSEYFSGFEREAFRLERLPEYEVPQEKEALALYLTGEPLPPSLRSHDTWTGFLTEAKRDGKHIQRVRVVPDHLTPYIRFEIEWCYAYSDQAGEEICVLPEAALSEITSPAGITDFWLFDDRQAALLRYGPHGRFLSAEGLDEPEEVSRLVKLKRDLLGRAVPLRQYLERLRNT